APAAPPGPAAHSTPPCLLSWRRRASRPRSSASRQTAPARQEKKATSPPAEEMLFASPCLPPEILGGYCCTRDAVPLLLVTRLRRELCRLRQRLCADRSYR